MHRNAHFRGARPRGHRDGCRIAHAVVLEIVRSCSVLHFERSWIADLFARTHGKRSSGQLCITGAKLGYLKSPAHQRCSSGQNRRVHPRAWRAVRTRLRNVSQQPRVPAQCHGWNRVRQHRLSRGQSATCNPANVATENVSGKRSQQTFSENQPIRSQFVLLRTGTACTSWTSMMMGRFGIERVLRSIPYYIATVATT